jgi:hypothetical protein
MIEFLCGLVIGIVLGRLFEIWADWYQKNHKELS